MTPTGPARPDSATADTASVGALVRALVDAEPGARWDADRWAALPRLELLAIQRELGELRRRVDGALATASAELDRRSDPADGPGGVAQREGFVNATKQVADVTGGTTAEAHRLIQVGKALLGASRAEGADGGGGDGAGGDGDVGDGSAADAGAGSGGDAGNRAATPRFRVLAAAVGAGRLSLDSANAITAMLTRVAEDVDPEVLGEGTLERAERVLVERALSLPFDKLAPVIRQCEAQLDVENARRKEEARRDSRYLNVFENRMGVVVVDGRLDPETAAPLKAVLDSMVGDALNRRRDAAKAKGVGVAGVRGADAGGADAGGGDAGGGDAGGASCDFSQVPEFDDRTPKQMRADFLSDIARHALGCDSDTMTQPTATVVVRIGLEQLESGIGLGEIEGFDEAISAGALRRLAADAEVIPLVLGTESEVLDVGRARRLFTRPQRIALVERDGGCAWCHAPPSWCQAHHIRWWYRDHGPTDLDNGVMLCSACHHRLHRDHWEISVRDGAVWFTPPESAGGDRRPRRGGRGHYAFLDPPDVELDLDELMQDEFAREEQRAA